MKNTLNLNVRIKSNTDKSVQNKGNPFKSCDTEKKMGGIGMNRWWVPLYPIGLFLLVDHFFYNISVTWLIVLGVVSILLSVRPKRPSFSSYRPLMIGTLLIGCGLMPWLTLDFTGIVFVFLLTEIVAKLLVSRTEEQSI